MLVLRKINYQKTFRNMEIFRRNASNHPLSIETSCDDTGNAIMKGNQILSDKIHTQLESNSFGGIIPPVAADIHRKNIERVIKESFEEAAISINDLDAIAVTNRPGLGMSLRIGLRYAKHLSRKFQKPLIPIHHMEAHALTARIENEINFPFLCLLISGGHSLLTFVNNVDDFKLLGDSIDDAPGEAFDKIARFLKLRNLKEFENKSGGKSIEDAAKKCIKPSDCYDFPFMLSRYRDCQFSFAGLKNKAKRHIIKQTNTLDLDIDQVIPDYEDFCANFQGAVARHICNRTQRAMEYCEKKQMFKSNDNKTLVISGGVAFLIKNADIKTDISMKWIEGEEFRIEEIEKVLHNHEVPVANCSKRYFDSHEKLTMPFSDYVKYWRTSLPPGDFYLKDFHLKQEFPDYDFYNVPKFFASDWLNEYLIDNNKDDYRFIYIGKRNTWTPFHSDVFGSFSWSANLFGHKRWLILPPGEEEKLKDTFGTLPFSITQEELTEKNVRHFNVVQGPDDILFIPSKWFHQVYNLDDVVSINHNWFNGCNINFIIDNLLRHYHDVEIEISDCKDMENFDEHCQVVLKASFGMNLQDFVDILKHIAEKRIESIVKSKQCEIFNDFYFGLNITRFDLKVIEKSLSMLISNESVIKHSNIIAIVNE
ncbi:CLUMA_CG014001, isoform A, partial [Clunio marinus]